MNIIVFCGVTKYVRLCFTGPVLHGRPPLWLNLAQRGSGGGAGAIVERPARPPTTKAQPPPPPPTPPPTKLLTPPAAATAKTTTMHATQSPPPEAPRKCDRRESPRAVGVATPKTMPGPSNPPATHPFHPIPVPALPFLSPPSLSVPFRFRDPPTGEVTPPPSVGGECEYQAWTEAG